MAVVKRYWLDRGINACLKQDKGYYLESCNGRRLGEKSESTVQTSRKQGSITPPAISTRFLSRSYRDNFSQPVAWPQQWMHAGRVTGLTA